MGLATVSRQKRMWRRQQKLGINFGENCKNIPTQKSFIQAVTCLCSILCSKVKVKPSELLLQGEGQEKRQISNVTGYS